MWIMFLKSISLPNQSTTYQLKQLQRLSTFVAIQFQERFLVEFNLVANVIIALLKLCNDVSSFDSIRFPEKSLKRKIDLGENCFLRDRESSKL